MNKFDDFNSMLRQDDTIFHYTKGSIVLENIFSTKQLRFSSLKNTNDPREYKHWIGSGASGSDLSSCKDFDKKWNKAKQELDHIRIFDFKVSSFCSNKLKLTDHNDESNKIPGYTKSRMWAQYGDNHYGVCLVFSIQRMVEAIKNQLGNEVIFFHDRVDYSPDSSVPFEFRNLDGNALIEAEDLHEFALNHINRHYKKVFFIKHIDYQDEDEFKFIVYYPGAEYFFLDISACIQAVIVGDRFHEVYRPLVKQFCSALNIEYHRLYWSDGRSCLIYKEA
ncbi:MAG: DUF2971 domain-containing protein [bacterium]